ncbi:chaplin [Streptomyces gamaensis]|uniref:Chaplin n=1 Tax=Streptomyces gamaensis TaxID=1763542 RepID=A0ABW0YQ46_9ACTN
MRQATKKGLLTAAAATGMLAMTGGMAHADSGAQGAATGSPGVLSGNVVQAPVHVPVNACGNTVNVVGAMNSATGNHCHNGGEGTGRHRKGDHQGHEGHGGHHSGAARGEAAGSPGVVSGNVVQAPVTVPVNACGNSINVAGVGNSAHDNDCVNQGDHGRDTGEHHAHKPPHQPPGHENPPCDDDHHHGHQPPAGHDHDRTPPAHHNPGDHQPGTHTPGEGETSGEHRPQAPHTPLTPAHHHVPGTAVKSAHAPAVEAAAEAPQHHAAQLAHTGAGELGMAGAASAAMLLGGAALYRRARAGQN